MLRSDSTGLGVGGGTWLIIIQRHKERDLCHLANVAAIWAPFYTFFYYYFCFVLFGIKMTTRWMKTSEETTKHSVLCLPIPLNDMKWSHNCWSVPYFAALKVKCVKFCHLAVRFLERKAHSPTFFVGFSEDASVRSKYESVRQARLSTPASLEI